MRTALLQRVAAFLALFGLVSQPATAVLVPTSNYLVATVQNHMRTGVREVPTPVFKGSNPRRDPVFRAGHITARQLSQLQEIRTQQRAEQLDYLIAGEGGELFSLLQGGAGGTGGGGSGSGEGSGSGGGSGGGAGSGGGGGASSSGSSGGSGGAGTGSSSGGPSSSSVNTHNGNRLFELPIVGWASRGQSGVSLSIHHSSLGDAWLGRFGTAWTHSYEWKIDYVQNESCFVRTGDGSELAFTQNGTTFSAPAGVHLDLVRHGNGSWTLTTKHGAKLDFNSNGVLQTVKDRNNNTVTLAYNANGLLTTVTDPSGKQLTFVYNAANRVSSVTDPANRTWSFGYSGTNLTSVTMPTLGGQSYSRTFTYNSTADILTETDLRGNVWTCTYDAQQRLTGWSNPLGHTTGYTYSNTATTITLPGGQTVVHNYSNGLLASEVDPAGFSQSYTYDPQKNRLTVTDKRGKVWTYTYGTKGNVLTAKSPLNHTTTYTYNSFNLPLTVTNPLGHVTTQTYDANGNMTSLKNGLNQTKLTVTYNTHGDPISVVDGINSSRVQTYDTHGNVTAFTDPMSSQTFMGYDALNRINSITNAANQTSQLTYDSWGRVVTETAPDGSTTTTTYDREGYITAATNQLGNSASFTIDAARRLTSVTDPRGFATTFSYNSNNWLTSVTSAKGLVTNRSYNARGELTGVTLPGGSTRAITYNATGQYASRTNGLGQTINYLYDDSGRLTTIDYPTGTDTTFTYDSASRRTQMSDTTGTTSWNFDAATRLTSLSTPEHTLSYTYDSADRITQFVDSAVGTFTYARNASGQVTSLTNYVSEVTQFTYDALGRTTQQTLANGLKTNYSYDSRGRVSFVEHRAANNSVISSDSLTYDLASRVTSRTLGGVTTTYGYNASNHLLSESRPGYSASYTYDADGSRSSKTVNGVTENYTYNSAGRISTAGAATFSYDANSRRTTLVDPSGTTTYAYTVDDLTSSITKGSSVTSYTYNGLGSRVSRNGQTLYRAGVLPGAPVLRDSGATYTPGISERQGSNSYFHLLDGFGSVHRIHDAAGGYLRGFGFDAFGIQTWFHGTVPPTTAGFGGGNGSYTDPTTGGIGGGGGHDYEPPFGGGPSEAPVASLEGSVPVYGGPIHHDPLTHTANFFAGYGDELSFGITHHVREGLGANGVIDHNSNFYNAGVATGMVHGVAMDVASGGVRTIANQGVKKSPELVRAVDDIRPQLPPVSTVDDVVQSGKAGIYVLRDTDGVIRYVGQTNDFDRRAAEHAADPDKYGLDMEIWDLEDDEVLRDIKEQIMINEFGGVNGGQLINAINAISKESQLFRELQL